MRINLCARERLAPWNTPAYEHELQELLALAADYDIPTEVPFKDLGKTAHQVDHPRRA